MTSEPEDKHLLLQFEVDNFPEEYREYYKIKRNNFFAAIQKYPDLWTFFCKLDAIWKRELSDLEVGNSMATAFPMMIYINAHSKMRISMELTFSMCLQEGRSVLRDAVESVAHAHHMLRDPQNIKIWLEKGDPGGKQAFKKAFLDNKSTNLFDGISELHEKFAELSESGSHSTIESLYNKMTVKTTESEKSVTLNYTGVEDERGFAMELFSRLLTCFVMERTLFNDYKVRLQLDPQLIRMRQTFEAFKERLRRKIINDYNIKPPAQKPKHS